MAIIKVDGELLNACLKSANINNRQCSIKAGLSPTTITSIIERGTVQEEKFLRVIYYAFDEDDIEPWKLNNGQACRFNAAVACEDISFVKCLQCGWCPTIAKERKERAHEIFDHS